jgi:glycine/D-amino acid oxidase-like deaminating enzyme
MSVAPTTQSIAGRVAVIGSGLAGLTTAYLLVREGFEVFLIEKVCLD